MATEDNTQVTISDYDTGVRLESTAGLFNPGPSINVTLNAGESYVFSAYYDLIRPAANASGLIGGLIESSLPVVVSVGSWLGAPLNFANQDIGIDQIVPIELTGTEYIIVRGDGPASLETPLVVATEDNTSIFINGSPTPIATINAGDFYRVLESNYTVNENLYIECTSNVYLYQMLAGANDTRTGGLNFVPPLGCSDESSINNIMDIDLIGNTQYEGKLFIVAEAGTDVFINGSAIPSAELLPVQGNPEYVTHKAPNLSGLIDVSAAGRLQVGIFGRNQAAGWSGYFSGFEKTNIPKIELVTSASCDGTIFINENGAVENIIWYKETDRLPFTGDTIFQADPGTYYVIGRREFCDEVFLDTSEIVIVPEPFDYKIDFNNVPCNESLIGKINFTEMDGGFPPYTITVGGESKMANFTFDSLGPGIHYVLIEDDFGCHYFDTVEILVVEDLPLLELQVSDTLTCTLREVLVYSNGSSRGSEFDYQWTDANDQILLRGSSGHSLTVDSAGTYFLTILNIITGCKTKDSIVVHEDVSPPRIGLIGGEKIDCYSPSLTLKAKYTASERDIDLHWSTDTGRIISSQTDSIIIDKGGLYQIIIINENNGCRDTASVLIEENKVKPKLALNEPDTLNCAVTEISLNGIFSTLTDKIHFWNTKDGRIIKDSFESSPIVDRGGTYHWLVLDTLNGCIDSAMVTVIQDTVVPIVRGGPDGLLTCRDTVFVTDAQVSNCGNCSIIWEANSGKVFAQAQTENAEIKTEGEYVFTALNLKNSCVSSDTIAVERAEEPTRFIFEATPPSCELKTASIEFLNVVGGHPPYSYSIDNGLTFSSESSYRDLKNAKYSLVIQDANGCILSDKVTFEYFEAVEVTINETFVELILGDDFQIEALTNLRDDQIESIQWTPSEGLSCDDCLDPIARPFYDITYELQVIDINGCIDIVRITFKVDRTKRVYIPNVFTPDNNGINDGFTAFSRPSMVKEISNMKIYSRWGELLFEVSNIPIANPHLGWDGSFHEEKCLPGVYVYTIEILFVDDSVGLFKGDVTLLR